MLKKRKFKKLMKELEVITRKEQLEKDIKEKEQEVKEVLEKTDNFKLLRQKDIELDILTTEQRILILQEKLERLHKAKANQKG